VSTYLILGNRRTLVTQSLEEAV